MPLYQYEILNSEGQPIGELVEFFQRMSEAPLTIHPQTGQPIRRAICAPYIVDGRPAWERLNDVRDHIRRAKPKWISDKTKGIRERFDPRKHG
jgi:predicted nucleic acid-binding Zn ribbon protein